MKLFGQLVRTVVNVAVLPVAVVKDVVNLGGLLNDERSATVKQVERIKREAEEE
jgi:hypothetical protein